MLGPGSWSALESSERPGAREREEPGAAGERGLLRLGGHRGDHDRPRDRGAERERAEADRQPDADVPLVADRAGVEATEGRRVLHRVALACVEAAVALDPHA